MKVMEVFKTIQGEGLFSGCPTTFIRFAGCTLACRGCDTVPSWKSKNSLQINGRDVAEVAPSAIIDRVIEIDPLPRHICITGGEPLEQDNRQLAELIVNLIEKYPLLKIVLETGGHASLTRLGHWIRQIYHYPHRIEERLCYSVDFKTPSTGREDRMILENFFFLTHKDIIKFVCSDEADFQWCVQRLKALQQKNVMTNVFFHTMGGKADKWLANLICNSDWSWAVSHFDIRFGVQLHKLLGMA